MAVLSVYTSNYSWYGRTDLTHPLRSVASLSRKRGGGGGRFKPMLTTAFPRLLERTEMNSHTGFTAFC